jgi:hypothetical protein
MSMRATYRARRATFRLAIGIDAIWRGNHGGGDVVSMVDGKLFEGGGAEGDHGMRSEIAF